MTTSLLAARHRLPHIVPAGIQGTVVEMTGLTVTVAGLPAPVGAVAEIIGESGGRLAAQVVGFRDDLSIVFPLAHLRGVRRGNKVRLVRSCRDVGAGDALLGRVINAHGECIDGEPPCWLTDRVALDRCPPNATDRPPIRDVFVTGIRAIDSLLTCGRGQRLGIFSGAGVGKSMTLGMLAQNDASDINVIALIGERGREVNEFLETQLPPEARQRSIVVVATADQPAILRVQAAQTATALAEHFRDQGKHVLLLMDSLTRFALASREVALAAGEAPVTRGFPASVFASLPRLVERSGCSEDGTITSFYTVLMESDDPQEPVADAVRSFLDGHFFLSRQLASGGHYPAIDITESISRVMHRVVDGEHQHAADLVRRHLSLLHENRDLLSLGAYQPGNNPNLDRAIRMQSHLQAFLRQQPTEVATLPDTQQALLALARSCQEGHYE